MKKRLIFFYFAGFQILIMLFFFLKAYLETTPAGLIGAAFCHQIAARSPRPDFPFCYRCTGIFLGILNGIMAFLLSKKRGGLPSVKVLCIFLVSVFLFFLDALNSSDDLNSFLYKDQFYTRFLSAFPMGFMLGSIVCSTAFFLFRSNDLPSADEKNIAAVLFPVCCLADFFMLFSRNPFLCGTLSVLSCTAAFCILVLLHSILVKAIGLLLHKNRKNVHVFFAGMILAGAQICLFGGLHLFLKTKFGLIF